jgi:hypothetical protein
VGVGDVSNIQTSQGRYAGHALVRSFIPRGWSVRTNAPEQASNLLCPLTIQVEYAAPAQDAFITFTGVRAYHHLEPTPQNAQQQGQLTHPDRIVALAYRDAGAICDGILTGNPTLSDVRVLSSMDSPDPWARKTMEKELQEYARAGTLNPGGSWAKKYATVRDASGQLWHKQVEAMVTYAYLPVSQQEQMIYQMMMQRQQRTFAMGGMLGMKGLGGMLLGAQMMGTQQIQPPQPKLRWVVPYVIETSAREGRFAEAMEAHEKIRSSMSQLPLFQREQERLREAIMRQAQQESALINDALSQMNRDQMDSWNRRQQILRDTSDYGSSVMEQMRQSNAQTQQRFNNLRSESIRGVNTYHTATSGYGVPPVVEASTQWDHVYQNTRFSDQFAASTGEAPLEFGVDFEELHKTDGNY